jgi:hypothetical protein
MHQQQVDVRHALTEREFDFCRIYAAFGEKNAAEAYRRSYCVQVGEDWVEKDSAGKAVVDAQGNHKALDSKEVSKRASAILKLDHIAKFMEKLRDGTGEHARAALADQVLFASDENQRLKAAQRVLDDEDKLGFRDAADAWAERMCAIGAEVVVPVPGGGEVAFHAREMFPRYAEALPPVDVLVKTMKSLDQYAWLELGRAKGEERDPADWKFLDGWNEFSAAAT